MRFGASMFKWKVPDRLDRPSFWVWVVPMLLGHILLTFMTVTGAKGLGVVDTLLLIFYSRVLGSRFRDVGWPVWIAPAFVIVTMIAIPLVGVGIAISSQVRPAEVLNWLGSITAITGPANLLLMIVAGSVPGRERHDPPPLTLPVSPEAGSPPTGAPPALSAANIPADESGKFSTRDALVVAGGALVIVLIIGMTMFNMATSRNPVQQVTLPPARLPSKVLPRSGQQTLVQPQMQQVESNGLTKATNDFLRQQSQQPASRK